MSGFTARDSLRASFLGLKQFTRTKRAKKPSLIKRLFIFLWKIAQILIIGFSLVLLIIYLYPKFNSLFYPIKAKPVEAEFTQSSIGGNFEEGTSSEKAVQKLQVERDENLPEGDWLIISSIGVRTEFKKTSEPDEALEEGAWQVPGFADPGDLEEPVIIAAHRYGFKWMWQTFIDGGNSYALRHTFYNLPDTQIGDVIEIISDQKKYTYEIYAGEKSDEISDYSANLILYTCESLNSPERHIRYARLVDLSKDTQD